MPVLPAGSVCVAVTSFEPSPELRKRMQGKSCFNFTKVDEGLFDELSDITAKGREMFADQGWLAAPQA